MRNPRGGTDRRDSFRRFVRLRKGVFRNGGESGMFFLGKKDAADAYIVREVFLEEDIEGGFGHVHDACCGFCEFLDQLFLLILVQGRGFKRDDGHMFSPEVEKE
nr:hypothetical protein [uncultured Mailhella sp.]